MVAMLKGAEEACPAGHAASLPGPRTEGVPSLVLAKEGIYNAVGTCAYDLHDFFDFPSWFRSALSLVPSSTARPASPLLAQRKIWDRLYCLPQSSMMRLQSLGRLPSLGLPACRASPTFLSSFVAVMPSSLGRTLLPHKRPCLSHCMLALSTA